MTTVYVYDAEITEIVSHYTHRALEDIHRMERCLAASKDAFRSGRRLPTIQAEASNLLDDATRLVNTLAELRNNSQREF